MTDPAPTGASTDDPTYALLAELELLEDLRERLQEGEPTAPTDVHALGLSSLAALDERIAALHRHLDDVGE